MRTFGRHGMDVKTFISILGTFLLRSMERSERIYHAICSRGFDGSFRLLRDNKIRASDIIYAAMSIAIFIIFRKYDIVKLLGDAVLRF
jgi:cobalt/nickel transport system permease protein